MPPPFQLKIYYNGKKLKVSASYPYADKMKRYKAVPTLKLVGNMLKDAGFEIGQTLTLIATGGLIQIKKEVENEGGN